MIEIFLVPTCRREMTRDDERFLKNFFVCVMGVIIIRRSVYVYMLSFK